MKSFLRFSFLCAALLIAQRAFATTTWTNTEVNSSVNTPTLATTMGANGFPQMAWIDNNDQVLTYAYQDGSGFHSVSFTAASLGIYMFHGADSSQQLPQIGIALDSSNVPHIVFGAQGTVGINTPREVWYGTYSGSGSITTAANWSFHVVASYTSSSGSLEVESEAIAIDPTVNRPAIAWLHSDGGARTSTIFYSTLSSTGTWPAGTQIAQATTNGDESYNRISFAVSASGKHAFTTAQSNGTSFNHLIEGNDLSGTWAVTPTILPTPATSNDLCFAPQVAFDSNNLPRIAWSSFVDCNTYLETTTDGANWTDTKVMSAVNTSSAFGALTAYAINANSVEVIATWESSDTADNAGNAPWIIRAITRSGETGAWTSPQTVESTSFSGGIGGEIWAALDSSNNAVIGYALGEQSTPGSVWQVTGDVNFGVVPTVTGVSPTSGPAAGGTSITLTGTGFTGTTGVKFGSVAGTAVNVVSDTSLTVTSPAGSAGTVDIVVTNGTGASSAVAADHYTYIAAPVITGVSPGSGPAAGGTSVTLTGSHFTNATAVKFGTASGTSVVVVSDTSITVNAPAGTGLVDITVITPGGTSATSSADQFTYIAAPTVSAVNPNSGPTAGGTLVTVTGTNLTGATAVKFGGANGTSVNVVSGSSLTVNAPAGAAGTIDVTVVTGGGTSATGASDHYTYVALPTVTSLSITAGPAGGGTTLVVTGTNLTGATAVKFGTASGTSISNITATTLTVTSPAVVAGTVDVTVTTAGGTSAVNQPGDQFTYVAAPVVSGVSGHANGPVGGTTMLTISGSNFTGATAVTFGGVNATAFTVVNATTITATAPAGTAGTVDIRVTTTGGTSATNANDHFTYVAAPAITSVTPASGPLAGASVTLAGTDFTNVTALTLGGTPVATFNVVSSTSITATVPAAGAAGAVDFVVTAAGGTSSTGASDQFTYVAAPTVTSLSVVAGPTGGGTTLVVTGTNLTGAMAVKFGAASGTAVGNITATTLTVTAPAGAAGAVDVTVTTVGGISAVNPPGDQFTYVTAPAVTSVTGNTDGPLTGGTSITITGTNFLGATSVTIGGTNATTFTVVNATTITATTPVGTSGAANVRVTTVGGTSAINGGDQFDYLNAPAVSQVSPVSGPFQAGTSVTITGSNFTSTSTVNFGTNPATNVLFNSATSLTVAAPAAPGGVAGPVDVTVTTDGGASAINAPNDQFTYVAAPTVTSLTGTNGPLGGGTTITVHGTNLFGATAVKFGAASGTGISNITSTSLNVTSPAGLAGAVDITVITVGGTAAINAPSDQFTYVAAPTVTSIGTNAGPLAGGTSVSLTGTDFTNVTAVSFGATGGTFTVNSPTSITATSPAEAAGTVDITVTAVGGTSATSSADQYIYTPAPVFSSGITGTGVYNTAYTGSTLYQAVASNAPTYTITAGALPTGLTLNASTGTITGTPTQTGSFPITITATNAGGAPTLGVTIQINKAVTTVALSNLNQTYSGSPESATATPGVAVAAINITYGGLSTPPTTAGTYAVVATISDPNYQGAMSGSLVIAKASTSVTWATPAAITYNTPLSATQLNAMANVPGAFTYSPLSGTVLAAGTQSLGVTFTPTDTTDYTGSTGSVNLQVNQATAPIALSNLNPTYDGTAKSATATTTPTGLTVNFTYGGSSTPPTTAGTYAVVATISDANYIGTTTGSLVIGKATATVTLGSLAQTYSGTPESATATTSPGSLAVTFTYNTSATPPTGAGSYAVVGTINDTNYQGSNTGTLVIGKATAPVVLGNLTQTYTGSGASASATTTPSGLTVNFTYGGSSTLPIVVGNYPVVGTISDVNYQGSQSGTLAIQQASQTIFFPAPVPTTVGSPVALSASASSGLAITYTVSGNATLSGASVTPLDTSPVSITASQSGNANYLAATSVTRTISAAPAPVPTLTPQTITVGPLPSNATTAKAFTLAATASSGLPVTYTLTGGPATLSGATVTPTGLAGTITIVISQAGNGTYSAAPSVTISVPVTTVGPREFFGTFTVVTSSSVGPGLHPDATLIGTIAAVINATNTSGTILGTVGGSAFVATITIAADGAYTGATTAITAPGSAISGPLTFAGNLSGNTLSGTIAELHASFSIPADSGAGVTAFIAGFYAASSLDSSSGSTYTVVGTQGELLVVTITPAGVSSAMGTVSAAGAFTVATSQAVTVAGSINATTTSLTGTVTTPTGGTVAFSGLSGATAATDRLVNLSSRGTISGSNLLVSGLVISGPTSKTLLLRAIGPGLAGFGVPGVLAHPHLQLFDSTGRILSDSTAWGGSPSLMTAFSLTGAFPLAATSADAAVLMTLAPGQYTLQVSDAATDAGGAALAEIYDADAHPGAETQRLINISTRAFVSPSTTLTGGFVVTGNTPKTVLIRGIGPGLTGFGIANALADPALTLFDGTGAIIAQNDNWGTPVTVSATQVSAAAADITAADLATGAFTLAAGSKDAALIVTLPPGSYTAQVTGAGGAMGTALVEVYEMSGP